MTWKRILILVVVCAALTLTPLPGQPSGAEGAVDLFASPVQAGCYLVKRDRCKIHVDPFAINFAGGQKLVFFQLVTIQAGTGIQRVIYDFRTDVSNPVPFSGDTYTPSLVAKDYAVTCGNTYSLSLQGQGTGDVSPLNLGMTGKFTCPAATYIIDLPLVRK